MCLQKTRLSHIFLAESKSGGKLFLSILNTKFERALAHPSLLKVIDVFVGK
jgi:hypothetical protein